MKIIIRLWLTAACLCLPSLHAQDNIIRLNTQIEWDQTSPSIASDADGNVVAVWQSGVTWDDSSGLELTEIFARLFDHNGQARGPEFQVNTLWTHLQEKPAVAIGGNGRFAVVWVSYWIEKPGYVGLSARIYDLEGTPQTAEFQVNQYSPDFQGAPDIAMDTLGNIVIVWHSWGQDGDDLGVFARRFDPDGQPEGPEFQVNQTTAGDQMQPAVAVDDLGNFITAWTSYGQDGDKTGIFARKFDRIGQSLGPEFQVNYTTMGWQENPDIVMSPEGGFFVCWQSDQNIISTYDIYARVFDRTTLLKGPEFKVHEDDEDWQVFPSAAGDGSGNVLITWQSRKSEDGRFEARARIFDSSGIPFSETYSPAPSSDLSRESPRVFMLTPDLFGIIWQGLRQNDWDIYGRFYRLRNPPNIDLKKIQSRQHEKKKNINRPSVKRYELPSPSR